MIGRISGTIVEKNPDMVLVDVSGVAYEVEIPLSTYYRLGDDGSPVVLHTHMVVREDAQLLYGFVTRNERQLFRSLIRVNKVGPRIAVAILSSVETDAFVRCIREKDVKTLNAIPGVGKVMAERLVVEMSNRLSQWAQWEDSPVPAADPGSRDLLEDAESALVGLGFKPQEASRALAGIGESAGDVESMIKQALRALTS